MRTRTIVVLVIIAAAVIGGIYGWNEYHRTNKSLSDIDAAYHVQSADLISEFDKSDSSAQQKYLGKVISVSGSVKKVEKDDRGDVTVVLGGGSGMSSIRCSMDSMYRQQAGILKEGEPATIKGSFSAYQKDDTGLLGSDIILNRCVMDSTK